MIPKQIIFFILISLYVFLSFPKTSSAEIATVKDWIGLFQASGASPGNTRADTYNGCPNLYLPNSLIKSCWVYTSSCTQIPGLIPRLDRSADPCTFTLNPSPSPGYFYVFRLYANNNETADGLIAASKPFGLTQPSASPTPSAPSPIGKIYRINGNLTINSDMTVKKTGVIFVDGNLYINHNLTNDYPETGLVFVVKGSIYIKSTVDTVNAFLIAHGKVFNPSTNKIEDTIPFCSAWNSTTPPIPDNGSTTCIDDPIAGNQQPLIINGSVISLNANLGPQFVRQKTSLSNPNAETINFKSKYLVIMKDVFSKDEKAWQEVQ